MARLLLLCLALASCKGLDPASCEAIGQTFQERLIGEFSRELTGERLEQAKAGAPRIAQATVKACKAEEWSYDKRRCLSRAHHVSDWEACLHAGHD